MFWTKKDLILDVDNSAIEIIGPEIFLGWARETHI